MTQPMRWQPIDSAPRDSRRVLIYLPGAIRDVREAWWRMPYEEARPSECYWQTMNGAALDASVHTNRDGEPLGASHWTPLPDPPVAEEPTP